MWGHIRYTEHKLPHRHYLLSVCLFLWLYPIFIYDVDFSNYLLSGRYLLPLAPLLSLPAAYWLSSRPTNERWSFIALAVLIGISGYVYFLARMRIDIFNIGLMEALDKSFTRIYIVYQRGFF